MPDLVDLEIMLASKVPLIVLETFEEPRAMELIQRAGIKLNQLVYQWSVSEGLRRVDMVLDEAKPINHDPQAVLRHIKKAGDGGIYVLCDFHPFLCEQPLHVRLLKEIAMGHVPNGNRLILLSHRCKLPPELQSYSASMSLSLPNDDQLMHLIKEEASHWSNQNLGKKVKTDNRTLTKLVANLRGLTFSDARRLAHGVIFDDGAITETDIPQLNQSKFELLGKDGVLSYEYDTSSFASVGGLDNLKAWLAKRQQHFLVPSDSNLDYPKGVLLLGVQGGGKSLAARAVAGTWGIPLLRMDVAALYNKFIVETERNLRESLDLADSLAPCVLWLDEIEKAFTVDSSDNGTSKRLLGALLTWMAERKSAVFIVATSNDISLLPPELIRKGRLDEIFFVDLPSQEVRRDIFSIHLTKRGQNSSSLDLNALALSSDGFSGAEIEQVVVSALYRCQSEEVNLDTDHLLQEISSTRPLSVVMDEQIEWLRDWARERAVVAN